MNAISINNVPIADGHIESILIGASSVNVSFQARDCNLYTMIFDNVSEIVCYEAVNEDLDGLLFDKNTFRFLSANDKKAVLHIIADDMRVFECEKASNSQ